jgi:hypothetical protein
MISLGIKDYFQQRKQAKPMATVSTPTVADRKARSRSNKRGSKNSPAEMTRARLSAIAASASAQATADDVQKQGIALEFAGADATTTNMRDDDPNASRTRAANDPIRPSGRNNRVRNDMIASPASSGCLPLPNLTEPGDVDAHYYDNWAGEYCER